MGSSEHKLWLTCSKEGYNVEEALMEIRGQPEVSIHAAECELLRLLQSVLPQELRDYRHTLLCPVLLRV